MTPVTPRNLLTIPLELLTHITKDFDIETVQNFRKTCRLFYHYVSRDIIRFDSKLKELRITQNEFYKDTVKVDLCCTDGIKYNIIYRKDGNGCTVESFDQERGIHRKKSLELQDYAEAAGNDVGLILKIQRSAMKTLVVMNPEDNTPDSPSLQDWIGRESAERRMWKVLGAHLDTRNALLQVEQFQPQITAHTNREQRILSTLQYLDPRSLDYLHLLRIHFGRGSKMNLDAIVMTEHWKRASKIRMDYVWTDVSLRHFLHFKEGRISIDKLSVDDLVMLKEIRLQNPALGTFVIWFKRLTQQQRLNARIGPAVRLYDVGSIRILPIPNEEKQVYFGFRMGRPKFITVQTTLDNDIDDWAWRNLII